MACACAEKEQKQYAELAKVIGKYRGQTGALIPVLQRTQDIFGYLPKRAIMDISRGLKIPASKIYGVATFYAQFHLKPRGEHIVRVCLGTACHVRGGEKILEGVSEHLGVKPGGTTEDLKFTLERVACLGACGLAPAVMVDDQTFGRLTKDKVGDLLEKFRN